MSNKQIPPILGIDNTRHDDALEVRGKAPALHVRDAVNVDFTDAGNIKMRQGISRQTSKPLKNLWQSPLHGDCFASLYGDWVKFDPYSWEHEVILPDAAEGKLKHIVVNNKVVMCSANGIFTYDGRKAQPLAISTPAAPMVSQSADGSLHEGNYSFAVSWLRAGAESALSEISTVCLSQNSAAVFTFPLCFDDEVSHVRLYMTELNGSELRQAGEYPIDMLSLDLASMPDLGRAVSTQYLSPMKQGDYLNVWRGRILTATANLIYFSEPLAFHLMDERYSFIQMPQKITFIEPVDSGIWVGQFDHVAFLRGSDLKQLVLESKAAANPLAGSSFSADSALAGAELSQGGSHCAVWLSEKGYAIGTPSGQIVETQVKHLSNITGLNASAVGFDNRIVAIVS
ncbi:hypothetical protein D9K79_00860 [Acinetobacter cumulans]|uniref:Uncharacterized protein n=1 Tax=Acinetobacter cumulans TaxID=2136182 RepID=A0ABX9UAR5_9GAMM|nr:hypothetical protein [Acinetobacter cumulans]RLL50333.1 hypothetical protein D9K79_00860 [Acinetobacter cumulans]